MRYDRRLKSEAYTAAVSKAGEAVRSGPIRELASYPRWAQEMIESCEEAKQRMLGHQLWKLMKAAQLDEKTTRNFLIGAWRLVDQFPQYMAMNLLKVSYGRSKGEDMARRWLIRNMRVEQNHAQYWLDWAKACGIRKEEIIAGGVPPGTYAASHWCWQCSERDSLTAGIAATNYALEGSTGEWTYFVTSTPDYANSFARNVRRKAMRWLQLHAEYDDTHPWEALEIICTLMGENPPAQGVEHVASCIRKTYEFMHLSLDHAF